MMHKYSQHKTKNIKHVNELHLYSTFTCFNTKYMCELCQYIVCTFSWFINHHFTGFSAWCIPGVYGFSEIWNDMKIYPCNSTWHTRGNAGKHTRYITQASLSLSRSQWLLLTTENTSTHQTICNNQQNEKHIWFLNNTQVKRHTSSNLHHFNKNSSFNHNCCYFVIPCCHYYNIHLWSCQYPNITIFTIFSQMAKSLTHIYLTQSNHILCHNKYNKSRLYSNRGSHTNWCRFNI